MTIQTYQWTDLDEALEASRKNFDDWQAAASQLTGQLKADISEQLLDIEGLKTLPETPPKVAGACEEAKAKCLRWCADQATANRRSMAESAALWKQLLAELRSLCQRRLVPEKKQQTHQRHIAELTATSERLLQARRVAGLAWWRWWIQRLSLRWWRFTMRLEQFNRRLRKRSL